MTNETDTAPEQRVPSSRFLTTNYLADAKADIWEMARKLRNQIAAPGFQQAAPYMAIAIGNLDQAVSELEKAICADTTHTSSDCEFVDNSLK